MSIVCIDPGVRHAGISIFFEGELTHAFLVKGPKLDDPLGLVDIIAQELDVRIRDWKTLIIEKPTLRGGPRKKGMRVEDIVRLSFNVGLFLELRHNALCTRAETPFPEDWKGTVKKEIMLERIPTFLTKEELGRVEWTRNKERNKDITDAIGIGLWKTGRMLRGGKRP